MPFLKLRRYHLISLVCCIGLSTFSSAAELWETLPRGDKAVHDFANIIDDRSERELESFLRDAFRSLDTPIVVVTLSSMEGGQIDDFANHLYEKWGVGTKPDNKGVLFLVSMEERKMRIETGYGTEPIITDVFSASLIQQVARPAFKGQQYSAGIVQVSRMIVGEISTAEGIPVRGSAQHTVRRQKGGGGGGGLIQLIFFGIVILSSLAGGNSRRGRMRRGLLASILLSSGGFRGGSGGGFGSSNSGGFGGFGGGFSGGGGSSGGW